MAHLHTLRPMGLLEIIDQTFRLYRANFWLFFAIGAVAYVPIAFLAATRSEAFLALALLLLTPGYLLVTGALTKAVSDRYMAEPARVGSSYAYVARRLGSFILTLLLALLFVASGLLMFVALIILLVLERRGTLGRISPWVSIFVFFGGGLIVFLFWVAFVTEVFIIEGRRYGPAIWRSQFLVGSWVWLKLIAITAITFVLAWLVQYPVAFGADLLAAGVGGDTLFAWLIRGIGTGVPETLALPIGQIATILLYYDSRIRKEGFDLEVLARELGKPARGEPATQPPASTPLPPPPTSSEPPPEAGL